MEYETELTKVDSVFCILFHETTRKMNMLRERIEQVNDEFIDLY